MRRRPWSFSALGRGVVEGVQVAQGVAQVLPLPLEDHVEARAHRLRILGAPWVAAFLVQAGVVHGRQKLADLGQGFGPYREHPLVGRGRGREEVEVDTIVLRTRAGLAERVERLLGAPLPPAGSCRESGHPRASASRELRTRLRRCQPTPGFIVRHALGVPASVDLAGDCGTDPRPSHEFARQAQGADRGESRQH